VSAGYPLERTTRLRDEMRLWAPKRGQLLAIDGVFAAATAAAFVVHPALGVAGLAVLGTGWFAARSTQIVRQASRRFRGAPVLDWRLLPAEDRTPVWVRGRVRAVVPLGALLSGEPAVARRVDISIADNFRRHKFVHIAAVDMGLVDERGALLPLEIGPSTLLWCKVIGGLLPLHLAQKQDILALPLPVGLGEQAIDVQAGESLIRDGELVDVAGSLSRVADGDHEATGRDPAWGRTIGPARDTPLMIRQFQDP
jgi:hypothetical protein